MESVVSLNQDDVPARIVESVGDLSGVVAVSLGGSSTSGLADEASDLDLHVYWTEPMASVDERSERLAAIADPGSVRTGLTSWGLEDHLSVSGRLVELIYRRWDDVLGEVERAYDPGLLGQGFTTAVLYSIARGHPLHDLTGELIAAKVRLNREFPEATRVALLRRESPLLGFNLKLLRQAQDRGDLLFAQHLRYKLQMLFFDLLFALNQMYHPGEKRLLEHSCSCPIRPVECEERWGRVARVPSDDPALLTELGSLVEDLRDLVRRRSGVDVPDEPL